LYSGEFSLAVMAHSMPFLFVAVAVKCAAFVWFSRRLLTWYRAILLMLLANIVSTAVGVAAAIPFTVPVMLLVSIPLLYGVSLWPARRYSPWLSGQVGIIVKPWVVAGVVAVMFAGSIALFLLAQTLIANSRSVPLGWYWFVKILYIYIALLLSTALTIYIEEGTISSLAGHTGETQLPFLVAVARANLVALLLITLVGAIKVLPARLASPNFLISW